MLLSAKTKVAIIRIINDAPNPWYKLFPVEMSAGPVNREIAETAKFTVNELNFSSILRERVAIAEEREQE